MRYAGWYARRRGLLQHLDEGTISLLDLAVHDFLCLIADHRNGVARASAAKIKALCSADISLRAIQRSLARLEEISWIKRFRVHGKRGNYAVVIGKYFVTDPSLKWKSVNLERTTDWRSVQFDAVTDPSFVDEVSCHPGVTDRETEASPIQEVRREDGKNEEPNQSPADQLVSSRCCLVETDPWKFSGLDRTKIDKEAMADGFEADLLKAFKEYPNLSHDESGCFCDVSDFLNGLIEDFRKAGKRYPRGVLFRKKELDALPSSAEAVGTAA